MNHNGTYYYYLRNGQGDIVKLVDGTGATVVEYAYDSWGKQLSCTGTLATTLGVLNPFRYRGYVYDEETQWYYLKSRYYDPETYRFISADVLLSTGQGVLGHNCYAYCGNNPGCMVDGNGYAPNYNVMETDNGGGSIYVALMTYYNSPKYYKKGEELAAINAFKEGKDVYYESAHLVGIERTDVFDASFSIFGEIHLHPNDLKQKDEYLQLLLQHEYGHITQEKIMGERKYIKHYVIPSVAYHVLSNHNDLLFYNYYNSPVEKGADILGGVGSRKGDTCWSEPFAEAYLILTLILP